MPSEPLVNRPEPALITEDMRVSDLSVGQLFNLLNAMVEKCRTESIAAAEQTIAQAKAQARAELVERKDIIAPFSGKPIPRA